MIIFIIILILLIVFIVWWINNTICVNNMLYHFKHCNVIVGGKKGTGKDLVFNYVIKRRNDYYYGNIDYSIPNKLIRNKDNFQDLKDYMKFNLINDKREIIGLYDVSVFPNTYNEFVNQNYKIIDRRFFDGKDIYVSDIGNFLPSYMDSVLYKKFPSMPLLYSLSRHLYANNVHCNTQNIERAWKALREQADFFVICKRTYKIFGLLITKCFSYDNYQSAIHGLKPLKKRMFNKNSKANYDLYVAQNGDIRQFYIFQRVSTISYDTRQFEKYVFESPRKLKEQYFPKVVKHFKFKKNIDKNEDKHSNPH